MHNEDLQFMAIQEQKIKNVFKRRRKCSSYQLMINYHNYIKQKQLNFGDKIMFKYKDLRFSLTPNQAEVLRLVAKGFSNMKIAKKLSKKEVTIKLFIYRLMKYLEDVLYESVDRFHLVIIAQGLILDSESYEKNGN